MTNQTADSQPSGNVESSVDRWRKLRGWARKVRLELVILSILIIVAFFAGFQTYKFLNLDDPTSGKDGLVLVLWLDFAVLFCFGLLLARRVAIIWIHRQRSRAGSTLLIRSIMLFTIVGVTPTILVSVFSVFVFNLSLKTWFDEPVSTAIQESLAIADKYLEEHERSIETDALYIANAINKNQPYFVVNRAEFNFFLNDQRFDRGLSEVVVITDDKRHVAGGAVLQSLIENYVPEIPESAFDNASTGRVAVWSPEDDDGRIAAFVRLQSVANAYLYVSKRIDLDVIARVEKTRDASSNYRTLEAKLYQYQFTFFSIFGIVGLLLLVGSVGVGIVFATNLTRPIGYLIEAAERVGQGDLQARVLEQADRDDGVSKLSSAFNRMTTQLSEQQKALLEANRQTETRWRFTQAVLSGVSAGVIGLDSEGRINLPNRSASELIGMDLDQEVGKLLSGVLPDFASGLNDLRTKGGGLASEEVRLPVRGRVPKTFNVTTIAELKDNEVIGYVVTFDDITELLSAQRNAAWSDVARRIAHEIKNPLTPIQLSAERIKRRYSKQITDDLETFVTCTDTIIRQVGDIGRMVDEFSNFARSPAPKIEPTNVTEICRQVIFMQSNAFDDVHYESRIPNDRYVQKCDGRLISQALINLAQNAADAIETRRETEPDRKGSIRITLGQGDFDEEWQDRSLDSETYIMVEDSGLGIPAHLKEKLTEPYVTTRAKGTGLGLAIVKKIMEDHGGDLIIADADHNSGYHGARIILSFSGKE